MASTDATPLPIKNQAYRVTFPIFDADGDLVTGATGLDSEVSKDGGTFTDCTSEATEIATSSGMYFLDLTNTEMNADTVAIIVKTSSVGAKTTPIVLYPAENADIPVDVRALGGSTQSATDLKDFADDGYDPSTNKVQGVVLVDTLTTYTGDTPQTGDSFARLGAPAGASVSADILAIDNFVDDLESRIGTPSNLGSGATISANLVDIEGQTDDIGASGAGLSAIPWNSSWDAEVQSEVQDALEVNNLDHLVKNAVDTDFATTVHLDSVVGHLADNGTSATFDRTTDSQEAQRDNIGTNGAALSLAKTTNITGFNDLSAAQVNAEADTALSDVGLTTTVTGRIDAATSTRATPAQVNTEVDTALADVRLDELLAADSDIDGAAPPTVGSVFHELMSKTAGSFTYDQTTDSNEALRDRGDAAWTTATGFSTLSQADVRTAVGLASANLDSQLGAIDDFLDTEIAAIKAKTDNLPSDPADQSAVEAAITTATSPLALQASVDDLEGRLTSARAGYLDNLNVGGNVASAASIAALNNLSAAQVWAAATRTLTASLDPTAAAIVTELLATTIEGRTFEEILKDVWATTVGDAISDHATSPTEIVYEGPDGTTQVTHDVTPTTRTVS